MEFNPITSPFTPIRPQTAAPATTPPPLDGPGRETTRPSARPENEPLRDVFRQFVGETFYGQLLKSMRSTVGKPAYFHGGRGEEIFTGQLDQQLGQSLAESSASSFADPMFDLFMLGRPN